MKPKKILYILMIILVDIYLLVVLSYAKSNKFFTDSLSNILIFLGMLSLLSALFILGLYVLKPYLPDKIKNTLFEEEEIESEKAVNELRTKLMDSYDKKNDNQFDILELMLDNMKEIRDYYIISKKQAKNAFTLAIFLCIIGFIFIVISIAFILLFKNTVEASILSAIGGIITEIIACTTLIVYKSSLEQLNNYYESLHNNERFLSLVNIVNKISNNKQDEAYLNIINVELQNYRNKSTK